MMSAGVSSAYGVKPPVRRRRRPGRLGLGCRQAFALDGAGRRIEAAVDRGHGGACSWEVDGRATGVGAAVRTAAEDAAAPRQSDGSD